ncbi:MAG: 1-acyl-sn-glycerol-3-phosphate acyltransferase [Epsilonproteobacteria bacterium]|nr:1-acyl-sn-glycerol-3-phosphate acyltransferase [Campylobacterota bacterium]
MKIAQRIKAFFIFFEFVITVTIVIFLMIFFNTKNWDIRRAWAKLQSKLIGYEIEIEGEPDPNTQMLLLNHQSLLDIVVLEDIYPKDIAWVAKKEIGNIPFFGKILTVPKMIEVERENKKSLIKLFSDVKERLQNDRVVAIFPEGTRGDGRKLASFKSGAKLITTKLELIVQPVVLLNTRNILDSKNFTAKRGKVKVIYLDSVRITKASDKSWFESIRTQMQNEMNNQLKID